MYKISELYDLDHTLAKDYLAQFEYPWQALAGIKELILELGKNLGKIMWKSKSMFGFIKLLMYLKVLI